MTEPLVETRWSRVIVPLRNQHARPDKDSASVRRLLNVSRASTTRSDEPGEPETDISQGQNGQNDADDAEDSTPFFARSDPSARHVIVSPFDRWVAEN